MVTPQTHAGPSTLEGDTIAIEKKFTAAELPIGGPRVLPLLFHGLY